MISQNILKFIDFNLKNFDLIQTAFYSIITLSILLLLLWFTKDLSSRIENKYLKFFTFVLVVVLNIPGFLFYLVLRPRETILEREERLLLSKRQEAVLLEENLNTCPHCATVNKKDFKFCINCSKDTHLVCSKCTFDIQPYWTFCPSCQTLINLDVLLQPEFKPKKQLSIIKLLNSVGNLILDIIVKIVIIIASILRNIWGWVERHSGNINQGISIINIGTKLNEAAITPTTNSNFTKNNATKNLKVIEPTVSLKDPQILDIKKSKKKKRRKKKD